MVTSEPVVVVAPGVTREVVLGVVVVVVVQAARTRANRTAIDPIHVLCELRSNLDLTIRCWSP